MYLFDPIVQLNNQVYFYFSGGVVLWSRSFTPAASNLAASSASPVNNLVRDALIEGRNDSNKYEKDGYAIKWTFVNELELIFVVRHLLNNTE
jgi:signal recognition particle receptor subunit alpha